MHTPTEHEIVGGPWPISNHLLIMNDLAMVGHLADHAVSSNCGTLGHCINLLVKPIEIRSGG